MIDEKITREIVEEDVGILPVIIGGLFSLGTVYLQYRTQRKLAEIQAQKEKELLKLSQQMQAPQPVFPRVQPTRLENLLPYAAMLGGTLALALLLRK